MVTWVGVKRFPPLGPNTWIVAEAGGGGGVSSSAFAVKPTGDPSAPVTVAVAVWVPGSGPRVQVVVAMPSASVSEVGGASRPPSGVAQVTATPSCGSEVRVITTRSSPASASPTTPV